MNPTNPFLSIFASSPMGPMQQHMTKVQECVSHLTTFFDAAFEQNWQKVEQEQLIIAKLESEADQLKKDLRLHLPDSLFMPVARTDLLSLLSKQDNVANRAKDIAGLITGRHMIFPSPLVPLLKEYIQRCIDASEQALKAIQELDELVAVGFKGREVRLVEKMIHKLDDIEHDTDEMQITIRRKVFEMEAKLPPIDVMFLYKIIEWVGDIADRAEAVGSRLEIMLAK